LIPINQDENVLINLNTLKNNFLKKLKHKNKEKEFRKNEKKNLNNLINLNFLEADKDISNFNKKSEINDSDIIIAKKENRRITKREILKKRKRLVLNLKLKKINKQLKKRKKSNYNFLSNQKLVTKKLLDISEVYSNDWKFVLELQIKRILEAKKNFLNIENVTNHIKNMINQTNFIDELPNEVQNSNLYKLSLFNGEEYKDMLNYSKNISEIQDTTLKQNDNEKKLLVLREKLLNLKKQNNNLEDTKGVMKSILNMKEHQPNNNALLSNRRNTEASQEIELNNKINLGLNDKMNIKQQIVNYSKNIYENFDLKYVILYWIKNAYSDEFKKRLNNNISPKKLKKEDETKKQIEQKVTPSLEEIKKAKDINLKPTYAQPSDNIKKLLPFCNNIYTVQKNES
jgi:hypothetical protein